MFKKSRNTETGKVDLVAMGQRNLANTMSITRLIAGYGAAEYILHNPDYRSAALAGAIGSVAAVTDYGDGHFARRAADRLKGVTTRTGQWLDQLTDKFYCHAILGSIAMQEITSGNKVYGVGVAMIELPVIGRDIYTTQLRARQSAEVDIKSRKAGKVKAAMGMAVMTAAASPLTDSSLGQTGIIAGGLAFAITSVNSAMELRSNMQDQIVQSIVAPDQTMPIQEVA